MSWCSQVSHVRGVYSPGTFEGWLLSLFSWVFSPKRPSDSLLSHPVKYEQISSKFFKGGISKAHDLIMCGENPRDRHEVIEHSLWLCCVSIRGFSSWFLSLVIRDDEQERYLCVLGSLGMAESSGPRDFLFWGLLISSYFFFFFFERRTDSDFRNKYFACINHHVLEGADWCTRSVCQYLPFSMCKVNLKEKRACLVPPVKTI